jgi:hypothetical protein
VLGSGDVCYITIDLVQEAGYGTANWNACQQGHYVQPNAHLRLISNLTECLFEHMVSIRGSSAIPLEAFSFKTLTNIFHMCCFTNKFSVQAVGCKFSFANLMWSKVARSWDTFKDKGISSKENDWKII